MVIGYMIGSSAVRVMRESIQPADTARLWAGQETFTCPGRNRKDAANPARENVFPGYTEGADVNLKVGVLRIGQGVKKSDPHPEEKEIVGAAPELADYVAALKQRTPKMIFVALRQLLKLVRDYPRGPLLAAAREAHRYGLSVQFDLPACRAFKSASFVSGLLGGT